MIKLQEIIPGTIMDIRKEPGDVWQLIISRKWAAVGPKGYRMSYNSTNSGKRHAEKWAKTGKDHLGNDERKLDRMDKIHSLA
jgi:hypothetical protein